ncbi:Hypothetical_protein [Hexamita inflata]|uniref:Hypothetical_protein n=1 Tax=Hexamita inflata TaxID=28002 RepID=A0AA86NMH7_9EUKA|nr:Hypothetical protein HINF_LOCUS9939 [Hexamita inflata]
MEIYGLPIQNSEIWKMESQNRASSQSFRQSRQLLYICQLFYSIRIHKLADRIQEIQIMHFYTNLAIFEFMRLKSCVQPIIYGTEYQYSNNKIFFKFLPNSYFKAQKVKFSKFCNM